MCNGTGRSTEIQGGPWNLPKQRRIRSPRDFRRAMKRGRSYDLGDLVIVAAKRPQIGARLGISIRRTVCNAAGRNRIKRWIREAFRRNGLLRGLPVDVVVIVRRASEGIGYTRVVEALDRVARSWEAEGCAGQSRPQ